MPASRAQRRSRLLQNLWKFKAAATVPGPWLPQFVYGTDSKKERDEKLKDERAAELHVKLEEKHAAKPQGPAEPPALGLALGNPRPCGVTRADGEGERDEKPELEHGEKPKEEHNEKPEEEHVKKPFGLADQRDEKPEQEHDEKPEEEHVEKPLRLAGQHGEKPEQEDDEKPKEEHDEKPEAGYDYPATAAHCAAEKPEEERVEKPSGLADQRDEKPELEYDENPKEEHEAKPETGYDSPATAAHSAAETSTGTNLNGSTTDDFTKVAPPYAVDRLLKDLNWALCRAGDPCLRPLWPWALLTLQQGREWHPQMPVKDGDVARAKKCILGSMLYLFHEYTSTEPMAKAAMNVVTSMLRTERASNMAHAGNSNSTSNPDQHLFSNAEAIYGVAAAKVAPAEPP